MPVPGDDFAQGVLQSAVGGCVARLESFSGDTCGPGWLGIGHQLGYG